MLLARTFRKVPFDITLGPVRWHHWVKACTSNLTTGAGHRHMLTHE